MNSGRTRVVLMRARIAVQLAGNPAVAASLEALHARYQGTHKEPRESGERWKQGRTALVTWRLCNRIMAQKLNSQKGVEEGEG